MAGTSQQVVTEPEYHQRTLNGNGDDDSVDGFKNLMANISDDDNADNTILSDDESILAALQDVEVDDTYGHPLLLHVADAFDKTGMRKLSKETEEKLKSKFKVPDNCRSFKVPKVNAEIWQNLRSKQRVSDLRHQQSQNGLSIALTALSVISDKIATAASEKLIPKDFAGEILKVALDGANLVGQQFQELTCKRRQEIKPFLNPDYSGICSAELKPTQWLFGENLAETLKMSKTTATVIRNSTSFTRNRYTPYNTQTRSNNLNYQRPFTNFRGRGNGLRQRYPSNKQYNHPSNPTFRPRFSSSSPAYRNHPQ